MANLFVAAACVFSATLGQHGILNSATLAFGVLNFGCAIRVFIREKR